MVLFNVVVRNSVDGFWSLTGYHRRTAVPLPRNTIRYCAIGKTSGNTVGVGHAGSQRRLRLEPKQSIDGAYHRWWE